MFFETNFFKIYYEKYGNKKKSIIILPGWGNTRNTFYPIIEELKKEYSVYILDYPGFGNSPIPSQNLTIFDYAEGIKEWLKENGIHNPHIIAHSFGGRITALLIGKLKVKVDKVLLIDVAGIKRRKKIKIIIKEIIYKILKKITYLFHPIKQEKLRQKLLLFFSSTDYQNIPNSMRYTFQNIIKVNLKQYYKRINNDTLILWGDKDLDTPLKDAYLLKKIIKNSELIIYPNTTHYSYLLNQKLTINICKKLFQKKSI